MKSVAPVREALPVFTTPAGEAAVKTAYERVLAHWSAPHSELFVPTSFGSVHVVASGREDAPPILLLPAYFATAAAWYRNAGALSSSYRVYAVDLPGEANPSVPTRPIGSVDELAQCMGELMDGLGVDRAHLVGNSFGGFLAAVLAMRAPERVLSLTLISPAAVVHGILPFYLHVFLPKAIDLLAPWIPGHVRRTRRSLRWAFAGIPPDRYWAPLFYQVLLHGSSVNRVFPKVFSSGELSRVAGIPALLLVGDHERIYRPAAAIRAAKRLIPGIETRVIPHAHHVAAIANPDAVSRALLDFLARQHLPIPVATVGGDGSGPGTLSEPPDHEELDSASSGRSAAPGRRRGA